jgi:hypothetical protein
MRGRQHGIGGAGRAAVAMAAVTLLLVGSACGSSSKSTATDSAGATGAAGGSGGTGAEGSGGSDAGCSSASGTTVPDGHWSGPIVLDADVTSNRASGVVTSLGDGSIDLVVADGQVTGNKWSITATSQGQMEVQSAAASVTGQLTLKDGTIAGTASDITLDGSAVVTGTITVSIAGRNVDQPLNGTYPGTTKLTIESVSCSQVVATFIPDWAAKAGGADNFSGTYRWTGTPA